ncbi:MAG: 3'-5' exonuclease [Turicibacter sp.]|nr:3'-5' exonuclease [Turicibacter sp.]
MDNYLILDTETTGLSARDEVIELGIVDMEGNTVYHSLFNPSCSIGASAMAIHGITQTDVKSAPRFSGEWRKINEILAGKIILIYNAKFDLRMLNQTARIYGCGELLRQEGVRCVMQGYAKYRGSYRAIKLEQALRQEGIPAFQTHRVIGDCLMVLELVKKVGNVW